MALEHDHLIGAAVGITMVHHDLPYQRAFGRLEELSGQLERSLADLARDIVITGASALTGLPESMRGTGASRPGAMRIRALDDSVPARLLDMLVETSDLAELLDAAAQLAVETIPGCGSASITVICRGEPATIAASDDCARNIDENQYRSGDGPGVEAALTGALVRVDDVTEAQQEHPWRQVAAQAGVTASLSLPIESAANIAAALNLHTTRPSGWPGRTLIAADAVAAYIGDTVTLAYRMTRRDRGESSYWPYLN